MSLAERNERLRAALHYASCGWRVLAVAPGEKRPHPRLAPHGVKSATSDPELIAGWWASCPDANIAVACGAPGPQVLDIDNLHDGAETITRAQAVEPGEVATSRGRHLYFAGEQRGTVAFGFGELRGVGGYVLAPPSIHPNGKQYVWLAHGRRPLPPVPGGLLEARTSYGAGAMPDVEHVKPGAMYDFLVDLAVRLARAGIVHEERLARILLAEFKAVRAPGAVYNGTPADTRRIAKWAVRSNIAERERTRKVKPWRT